MKWNVGETHYETTEINHAEYIGYMPPPTNNQEQS